MLRIDYLPSDFHPMVLVLGEAEDLARVAAMLRTYADAPSERPFEAGYRGRTGFTLKPSGPPGMRPLTDDHTSFGWTLTPEQARDFADLIDELTEPGRPAGSEQLETGAPGEIPVKVSRGEYTDDFLLEDRPA